jgi:hypothetical protein
MNTFSSENSVRKARGLKDTYEAAESLFTVVEGFVTVNEGIRHLEVVVESQPHHYDESATTLRTSAVLRFFNLENSVRNLQRVSNSLPKALSLGRA